MHILQATRGGYGKAVSVKEVGIRWVDEQNNATEPPAKHRCEHPQHWQWGTGTRNGQKLCFPLDEMLVQKWVMTKKELREAVQQYDMASLEMNMRLICKNCAQKLKHENCFVQ